MTIARVLIATGVLLVNMAHIVGILFFESVDYHGPFQRFFARLSIFGTSAAVIGEPGARAALSGRRASKKTKGHPSGWPFARNAVLNGLGIE